MDNNAFFASITATEGLYASIDGLIGVLKSDVYIREMPDEPELVQRADPEDPSKVREWVKFSVTLARRVENSATGVTQEVTMNFVGFNERMDMAKAQAEFEYIQEKLSTDGFILVGGVQLNGRINGDYTNWAMPRFTRGEVNETLFSDIEAAIAARAAS